MAIQLSHRRLWILGTAITLVAVVLLALLVLPTQNTASRGSTYGRSPGGYGAWYAYMERQNADIQRWRQPFHQLSKSIDHPIVLLRVRNNLTSYPFSDRVQNWVKQGNTLVVLGIKQPVTKASFSTLQTTDMGSVKIETRRRRTVKDPPQEETERLGDRFGAMVWQQQLGQGKILAATTPYLGANAYQDQQGNYAFLAKLVGEDGYPIWVDEYIHGYGKETDSQSDRASEPQQDWIDYLSNTPLILAFWQGLLILAIAIWAGNRRFGKPQPLLSSKTNNSEAYIRAVAGILQKANRSDFLVETIGKQEQLALQKTLGLGSNLLEPEVVLSAWEKQTGKSRRELHILLNSIRHPRRLNRKKLQNWLQQWQQIHQENRSNK